MNNSLKHFKLYPIQREMKLWKFQNYQRDWSYKIRILPTVDNKSCEVKVPELEVFKSTRGFNISNLKNIFSLLNSISGSLKTTDVTPTSISLSWSDDMKSKLSE
jgi:hypothetical protein